MLSNADKTSEILYAITNMFVLHFGSFGIIEENVVLRGAGRSQGVVTNKCLAKGYPFPYPRLWT